MNVSIEKQRDGTLGGNLRIRSKTQGIALSLGVCLGFFLQQTPHEKKRPTVEAKETYMV